ncbi:MAG TPA: ABC transporter permease [Thermoanaerobaculia bacterium]|jgi:ABC transporter DrrB family efflux protein|nr:ABC transporter permease [Thermoanaerobaculia bacterium]
MSEPRRYHPLLELTLSRIREFVREPEALFWVFLFPVLLAVALGLAFREKGPDKIPVGIVAASEADAAAAKTTAALASSPVLFPRRYSASAGHEALRTGRISLLVEPGPPVVFRFDETRPDSRIARLEAGEALQRAAGRRDVVPVRAEKVTEKGARYIDFLVPGLLGMNLMGTGIWSLAFSVTSARTRRVLKRLVATPMRKSHYLLSQILGRLGFLIPEIVILMGAGWLFFGVAVRGSLLLLTITCLLGAMTFCGLGLLIASRVSTIEGASGLANLVMLPMWLLSGVFFSSERFPDAVQPFINALPLTALNQALRGIITEGRGLVSVAPQLAIVLAWGLASFAVALKIFRWR